MVGARWLTVLALGIALACSHPRLGPDEAFNSQIITEDEIVASRASTAFDVIHKLRANFLTNRGETSLNPQQSNPYPNVYLDNQEFGPIGTLNSIPAAEISMIRLYRAWEATTKFGTHNLGGVIAITTKQ
jgi:hypothetical protein